MPRVGRLFRECDRGRTCRGTKATDPCSNGGDCKVFADGSLQCLDEMNNKNTVIREYNEFVRDCHKNAPSNVMPSGPRQSESSAAPLPATKQTEKSGPDLKKLIEETKPKTVGAEEARAKQRKEMQTEEQVQNRRNAEVERQYQLRELDKLLEESKPKARDADASNREQLEKMQREGSAEFRSRLAENERCVANERRRVEFCRRLIDQIVADGCYRKADAFGRMCRAKIIDDDEAHRAAENEIRRIDNQVDERLRRDARRRRDEQQNEESNQTIYAPDDPEPSYAGPSNSPSAGQQAPRRAPTYAAPAPSGPTPKVCTDPGVDSKGRSRGPSICR